MIGAPKNCAKSTTCGNGCISKLKTCQIDAPKSPRAARDMARLERAISDRGKKKAQGLWARSPRSLKSLIDSFPRPDIITTKERTSYYATITRQIALTEDATPDALRHEYGHYLDAMLGDRVGRRFYSMTATGRLMRRMDEQHLVKRQEAANAEYDQVYTTIGDRQLSKFARAYLSQIKEKLGDTAKMRRLSAKFLMIQEAKDRLGEDNAALKSALQERGTLPARLLADVDLSNSYNYDAAIRAIALPDSDAEVLAHALSAAAGSRGLGEDLIGSITRNVLGQGHDTAYYDDDGKQEKEAFANVIALYGQAGRDGDRAIAELAPNLFRFAKRTIKLALDGKL